MTWIVTICLARSAWIFPIFFRHLLMSFCHIMTGSRSTKDFRQMGQASSSRTGSKERSPHLPAIGYWLLHRQTDERYAWSSNRNRSHNENLWSNQAAEQHLLPCPWLCSLPLCHYSTSIYGNFTFILTPLSHLLTCNSWTAFYSQKWSSPSRRHWTSQWLLITNQNRRFLRWSWRSL